MLYKFFGFYDNLRNLHMDQGGGGGGGGGGGVLTVFSRYML